jgi:hypothetical protein
VLLGRPPGRRLIERLAGLLARPGGLLLPVLPLAAVEVLRGSETGHGGWNDASYALFLVYGCLAAADPRIGQAFRRRCRAAMTLGGLLLVAAGGAFVAASPDGDPLIAMDLPAMGFRLLKSAAGWAWGGGHPGAGRQPGRPTRDSAPLGPGAPPGRLGQRRRAGLLRASPGGPISLRPEAHPGYHRPMTTAMRRFGCPPARCGLAGAFGMA